MATLKLSTGSAINYGRALRAIGRDIADRFPENLEIEVIGATYKALYHTSRVNTAPVKDRSPNPSTRVPEVRVYTEAKIDGIYDSQIAARKFTGGNPDIHNLAERLRTIGTVVELTKGKLLRVTQNAQSISFQYSDSSGQVHSEELTNQNIFSLQREYNAKRQNQKDDWNRNAR